VRQEAVVDRIVQMSLLEKYQRWISIGYRRDIAVAFLLIGLVWVARYWRSADFGLYADDITRIPSAMRITLPELMNSNWRRISQFSSQGRPLHHSLVDTFAFIAANVGGFSALYRIGYLVVATNSLLFYLLVRKTFPDPLDLIAALSFTLYSADTTQAFLTHSYGLQPALMLLFLALIAYREKRWIFAYILIICALLTYETVYWVFLAAPLLNKKWDKRLFKQGLLHFLILLILFGATFILRVSVGDGRIAALNIRTAILTSMQHVIQGPIVSLGTYGYRPIQALTHLDPYVVISFLCFLPILTLFFFSFPSGWKIESKPKKCTFNVLGKELIFTFPGEMTALFQPAILGIAMIVLAYPLTLNIRAYAISGRDTRVHFAAAPGAAILIASVMIATLLLLIPKSRGSWINVILAGYFSLLLSFGFVIQQDYVDSWKYQRAFWNDMLFIASDMGENTAILIDPDGLRDTRHIDANTWNLPRVLYQICDFPDDWENPPRVYRLVPTWQNQIITEDLSFQIDASTVISPSDHYDRFKPSDVILLQTADGTFNRLEQYVTATGEILQLKPIPSEWLNPCTPRFLFDIFYWPEREPQLYLEKSR